MGDPLHVVRTDHFDALFMMGEEDDPETLDNVDVQVTLRDGSRWSATFLTLDAIPRVMDRWAATGEALGGRYFHCPDLVIVREPGLAGMVSLLEDAYARDELWAVLTRLEETEDLGDLWAD